MITRPNTTTSGEAVFILALFAIIAALFGYAWALMLIVGIIHLDWWPTVPTMSYQTALLIGLVKVVSVFAAQAISELIKAVR